MTIANISVTPWDAATFAESLFVLITIEPIPEAAHRFDWKDITILVDDISEIRRNREDSVCVIFLESGLSHTVEFNDQINITVGGVTPTSNENLRDLLMAIKAPKHT
jgi:hypothetical protein